MCKIQYLVLVVFVACGKTEAPLSDMSEMSSAKESFCPEGSVLRETFSAVVCVARTSDNGKSCLDSDQCEGFCVIGRQGDYSPIGQATQGKCSEFDNIFGCNQMVENGVASKPICFD
jgi:hypothetical protein